MAMCGRYTLKTPPDQWGQLLLPIVEATKQAGQNNHALEGWTPRYNIAPTQNVLAVRSTLEAIKLIEYFRWGLVPSWAKDLSIGNRMINARAETLPEKRSFAGPLRNQRCLVIADGYYEWQKLEDGTKQPCWISPADGGVLCLAGLWEVNRHVAENPIQTCTIITTAANSQLHAIHDRMPVMLDGHSAETWLASGTSGEEAHSLLGCAEEGFFLVTQVSTRVNNPRHDSSDCIEPIDEK